MEKINVYKKQSFIQGFINGMKHANDTFQIKPEHIKSLGNNIYNYEVAADDYLHNKGIVLASIVTASNIFRSFYVILHDSNVNKLPEFVIEFLLQHEIGHAMNGDLEKVRTDIDSTKLVLKRALGLLPQMEILADAYAASINGTENTKRAIRFLIHNTNLPFNSKFELFRRYRRLCKNI